MNVLLIGDSIRLFYQQRVTELLGEDYHIYAPQENCRFSAYLLNSLRFYLAEFPVPDIIHFNVGLWDTAIIYKSDGCFTKANEYVRNIKLILRELKKTGAKIIFSTSTPVSDKKQFLNGPFPPAIKNEDIIKYNKLALEAFSQENIVINDLFSVIYPNRENFLLDDMIHPNDSGIEKLASSVANAIKSTGNFKNKNDYKTGISPLSEKTVQ